MRAEGQEPRAKQKQKAAIDQQKAKMMSLASRVLSVVFFLGKKRVTEIYS